MRQEEEIHTLAAEEPALLARALEMEERAIAGGKLKKMVGLGGRRRNWKEVLARAGKKEAE
jgi:hypothetical protein